MPEDWHLVPGIGRLPVTAVNMGGVTLEGDFNTEGTC